MLCNTITSQEIKEPIFSIPNEKSPGTDGYTNGFYKTCWGEIGALITEAIQKFFTT